MDRTKCRYHPEKDLQFFCCNTQICGDCKQEEHFDHCCQDLYEVAEQTKRKLTAIKLDVEKSLEAHKDLLKQVLSEVEDFEKSVQSTKETINKKADAVIEFAKQFRDTANKKLELLRQDGKMEQNDPIRRLHGEMDHLQSQKEEIETCLDSSHSDQYVIRIYLTLFNGKKHDTHPKSSDFIQHVNKCKVRVALNRGTQHDVRSVVQEYIGMPIKIDMSPGTAEMPSMCLVPQFQVSTAANCTITTLLPLCTTVCVIYSQNPLKLAVVTKGGKKLKDLELGIFDPSQLRMIHRPLDDLLVYSPVTHSSKLVSLINKDDIRKEYCWSKGENGSNVILDANPVTSPPRLSRKAIAKIQSKPRILAASHDCQYFAVVTDSDEVMIYQSGLDSAIMAMKPATKPSRPSSVCFNLMDDKLMLLIADAAKSLICVVDFTDKDDQRILGPLTLQSKLLTSPSALETDDKGTVWIGCDNGMVLTCVPTKVMLQRNQQLEFQEDSDGYLTPLEIEDMFVDLKCDDGESGAAAAMALDSVEVGTAVQGPPLPDFPPSFVRDYRTPNVTPLPEQPSPKKGWRISALFGKRK